MQFTIKKLLGLVCVAALLSLIAATYINNPARRVRLAGIDYNTKYKGGTFLHHPNGLDFDDESLSKVVSIASDFSRPHAIGISGNDVTDDGFQVFMNAPNISHIIVSESNVTERIFDYLSDMPDLVFVTIENCPNIDRAELQDFRMANPTVQVDTF